MDGDRYRDLAPDMTEPAKVRDRMTDSCERSRTKISCRTADCGQDLRRSFRRWTRPARGRFLPATIVRATAIGYRLRDGLQLERESETHSRRVGMCCACLRCGKKLSTGSTGSALSITNRGHRTGFPVSCGRRSTRVSPGTESRYDTPETFGVHRSAYMAESGHLSLHNRTVHSARVR